MKKQKPSVLYCTLLCVLIACSHTEKSKKYKESFYPSGKLKSSGWYIHDSIPIDTLRYFYENGGISSLQIRDNFGFLNGPTKYFYPNGDLKAVDNYQHDMLQGFSFQYRRSGGFESKVFYLDDRRRGDAYWYHYDGQTVRTYGFFDFNSQNRNLCKYDSLGKRIRDQQPIVFVDSVEVSSEADHSYKYVISILLFNSPHCSNSLTVNFLDRSQTVVRRNSISNVSHFYKKESFTTELSAIDIIASRFDSITKSTFTQKSNNYLEYEK